MKKYFSKNKYGNKKTCGYDSKKEYQRALVLKNLQANNAISDLKEQVKFAIEINNVKVCTYIADFTYIENGVYVVEDVRDTKLLYII